MFERLAQRVREIMPNSSSANRLDRAKAAALVVAVVAVFSLIGWQVFNHDTYISHLKFADLFDLTIAEQSKSQNLKPERKPEHVELEEVLKAPPNRYARGDECDKYSNCRVKHIDWVLPRELQPRTWNSDKNGLDLAELECHFEIQQSIEDVLDFSADGQQKTFMVGRCGKNPWDEKNKGEAKIEVRVLNRYSDAIGRRCARFALRFPEYEALSQSLVACPDRRGWVGPLTEPA